MTVIGYIFLAVAVGLLIVGFTSKKAWPAVVACFLGSFAVSVLFNGLALILLVTGVIALVALFFSRGAARVVVALGVIITLLVAVPVGKIWNKDDSDSTTSSGVVPSAQPASPAPPQDLGLSDEDAAKIGAQIKEIYPDFTSGEIALGAGPIPDSKEERGNASFTKNTIETREDLVEFFASSDAKAVAARERVQQNLSKAGVSDAEVKQALTSGDRWIWVAPNVESQVFGTTYSINNGVVKVNGPRQAAPNDAIWFYVTKDARIVAGAAVRADCGNPEVDKVRPVRPDTPPAPPIECAVNCEPPCKPCPEPTRPVPTTSKSPKPTCPDGKPINPDGTCPKDPSKDVNNNPAVPDPVKGPGTTPVGTDPGPATPATDSPTGCNGPCPRPTNDPAPPPPAPTDRPSGDPNGSPGNGGATPGPGPTDDSDADQTTAPQPPPSDGSTSGPICNTGNPDDC